jgi:dihydroorotate dehydrogenase
LSGAPLHALSVQVIAQLRGNWARLPHHRRRRHRERRHALATLRAGANLIQIYTGFAIRGPALLEEILTALSA